METQETLPALIVGQIDGMPVRQRMSDGYFSATDICDAAGKYWGHYRENNRTLEYLETLSQSLGIPRGLLTHSITNGPRNLRGTWVHPQVAVHLAQWLRVPQGVEHPPGGLRVDMGPIPILTPPPFIPYSPIYHNMLSLRCGCGA